MTGNAGWEEFPAFSPDGNQVAFSWAPKIGGSSDIYVKLIGGGAALRLTAASGFNFAPAWSPDSGYIAYLRQVPGGSDIFIVPTLGGPSRKIGHSAAIGYDWGSMFNPRLSWSLNGKYLALADKGSPLDRDSIFLLSIETGEKRRLTFPPGDSSGDGLPAFSPDGRRLAFAQFSGESGQIFVLQLDKDNRANGQPRRVALVDSGPAGLDWTPDGREILFSHNKIWRVSADGGRPIQLPNADITFQVAVARHSPRLAYNRLSFIAGIWRFNGPSASGSASSNPPVKIIASNATDISPQFSPDGKRVVFISSRSGSAEVWMSDNEGTAPAQLTTIGGDWLTTGAPRWSPDGKQIAFDSFRNGRWHIYILTIESRIARQLTTGSYDCSKPSWSRNGHWVYFRSRDQVRKIPAAGGAVIQVTRYGGDEPFESWDGKFVYYHKSDAIWKVSTAGGEENQVVDYAVRGHWSLMPAGICFLNRWQKPSPALEFFAFANRRRRIFAILPGLNGSFEEPALTASPDGRWVLCVLADHVESSIQLVDNFQ